MYKEWTRAAADGGGRMRTVDDAPAQERRRRLIAIAAIALAVLVAVLGFVLIGGDEDEDTSGGTLEGPNGAFTLDYPDGWRELSTEELAGRGIAGTQREDDAALLTVRQEGRARPDFERFTRELRREFGERFPDFRFQRSQLVQTEAGQAFSFSYVRTQAGTAHSVVIVPAGPVSFALNSLIRGDSPEAARELGQIIKTFDLAGR